MSYTRLSILNAVLGLALLVFPASVDHELRALAFYGTGPKEEAHFYGSDKMRSRRAPPELLAEAYLVRIAGSGEELLARRADKQSAPASLTKLLTAAVALEELASDELVMISRDAKIVEEKTSGASVGEIFARDDLIRMALISSANDAALALAEATGLKLGAYDFTSALTRFTERMNERARALGLGTANFVNPTGLDAAAHHASAEDVMRIMEYLWERHPRLLEFSRTIETSVHSLERKSYRVANTNDLLKEFPALLGGKTGFTDAARGALAMWYPLSGRRVALVVLLGSDERFEDGRKILRWLEEFDED